MPSSASAYGVSAPMPSGGAPGMTSSGGIDTAALIRAALANVNAAARGGSTAALGVGGAGMAATRPYRRLYVGNIPMCSEGELQLFFNQTIARAGAGAGEHVISTYVNHDKKFAFLEFKTVEMAHACLKLVRCNWRAPRLATPGYRPIFAHRARDTQLAFPALALLHFVLPTRRRTA